MASEKSQAVKVEAIKAHTYNGKSYDVGDVYDFYPSTDPAGISADDQVASLLNTGFAIRVDRVKVAKEQAKAAEKTVQAREAAVQAAAKPARAPKAPKAPKAKAAKK